VISERDLLIQLCAFISKKQLVVGDEASIKDMVAVYKNPPFTKAYPACIRLTMQDTYTLNELLKQAYEMLEATEPVKEIHDN
jgi:hypothetical protein